jgi:hypothetical protein
MVWLTSRALLAVAAPSGDYGGQPANSVDVTQAPYNVDKTGATNVADNLGGAGGVLATIRDLGKVAYFPAGNYLLSTPLAIPAGCGLVGPYGLGPSAPTAWLRGQVWYDTDDAVADLKIGPVSAGLSSARNADGCSGASFIRAHFRGGGGTVSGDYTCMSIGHGNDIANLAFTDCEWERSLGTTYAGATGYAENTLGITAQGNTVDGILFNGGTFGVSNGVATGAQRMMVECWTAQGDSNWWRDLAFKDMTFEASNIHQLDFACYGPGYTATPSGRAQNATVDGCVFKGGGVSEFGTSFGYGIVSESVLGLTVKNSTFYRCLRPALWLINFGWPADNDTEVTGNVFNFDVDYIGQAAARSIMTLYDSNAVVTGNELRSTDELEGWPYALIEVNGAEEHGVSGGTGHVITDNTLIHHAAQSYIIREVFGATGNTLTPNTEVEA